MKLVVAEKPSVAQTIASVLGATTRKDGYMEGNDWIVTWCIGHLVGFADAQSYDSKYAKWRYEDLPIIPLHWQVEVSSDKEKQFNIIKDLANSKKVSSLVNACDAGREGESIFRSVYELIDCSKPVERLWISSMEDSAIRKGFESLQPSSNFDGLYDAAICRAKADWLVGINATRLFSVLYHKTLNIGRVMSPTLSLIVQRESEISAFQPESFYTVELNLGNFNATSEHVQDKACAEDIKQRCKKSVCRVQTISHQNKTENPPMLYDLTSLQRDANRVLNFTAQQTLDYLQNLYEKKLCTYPRTDSRYLTSDMEVTILDLIHLVNKSNILPQLHVQAAANTSLVIDDKKVSDHHAIIPTKNIASVDISTLPVGERSILELVSKRLICAVGAPYKFTEVIVTIECAESLFSAKGKTITNLGWKIFEQNSDEKGILLPTLNEGQELSLTDVNIKKGQTSPPKHFTEDSLLASMENAGNNHNTDEPERKGLGTPATRAGILEKLVATGFVERKKLRKTVYLIPSSDAVSLITILPEQLQSPLLTSDWEHKLKEIEHGDSSPGEFMEGISSMVSELVESFHIIPGTEYLFLQVGETIGKCPRCGSAVAEMQKGFFCQNPSCKFGIWKNNKWWALKKKIPTRAITSKLLDTGSAEVNDLYSEKKGKYYTATVMLEDNGEQTQFKLKF